METLHHLPENSKVVVDGSKSVYIDYDVAEAIHEFRAHTAQLKKIKVELINIPESEKVGGH